MNETENDKEIVSKIVENPLGFIDEVKEEMNKNQEKQVFLSLEDLLSLKTGIIHRIEEETQIAYANNDNLNDLIKYYPNLFKNLIDEFKIQSFHKFGLFFESGLFALFNEELEKINPIFIKHSKCSIKDLNSKEIFFNNLKTDFVNKIDLKIYLEIKSILESQKIKFSLMNSETDTEQPLILKFLIGNTCILISTLEDEEDTKPDLF